MRILLLLLVLVSSKSFAQWQLVKDGAEKAADAELLLSSVQDLSDSIVDESELSKQAGALAKSSSQVRNTLKDLQYTEEEINSVLQGDGVTAESLAATLSRLARRIRRAKNLAKSLGLMQAANPAAVTATQAMEMNQTLNEIHIELVRQNMDRQVDKDSQRLKELEAKLEEKRTEVFFKRQFALMEQSSRLNNISYFPFKDSNPDDSQRPSFFSWGI